MSVILPYQYKYLADKLGEIYGKIRDAVYNESDPTSAYNVARATVTQLSNPPTYSLGGIEAESDATTWGCAPAGTGESEDPTNSDYSEWTENTAKYTAPPLSITKDLKTFWFQFANTTFNNEQAKVLATSKVSQALRNLNSHVVSRMSADTSANRFSETFAVSSILDYYNNYAFVSDANAATVGMSASQLSIFDLGAVAGLDPSPSYFSANFVELSSRIGVTIPTQYIAP
jgi:hypothetical protein